MAPPPRTWGNVASVADTAESSDKERRRARKRATDRKAQQSHRERREAYVKQLETSLRSLTEQHTADDRYKALHDENAALREQQSRLQARLRQIYNLANIAIPNDPCAVSGDNSLVGMDSGKSPAGTKDACDVGMETTSTILADATQQVPGGACEVEVATTENIASVGDMRDDLAGTQKDLFDELGDADFSLGDGDIFGELDLPQNSSLVLKAVHPPQHDNGIPVQGDLTSSSWGSGACVLSDRLPSEAGAFARLPLSHGMGAEISCSSDIVSIPRYCPPVGIADKLLTNFLEEARLEHRHARFDTSEPSLSRLLSDPPHTVLAFRLYHFLSGAGPMPLHIFMGIFWLQYLWLVLETRSAYARIPDFMRPTELEKNMPHRLFISMIVWPDLRQALIRDAMLCDPEALGAQMIWYLKNKWEHSDVSGAIASMNIADIIQRQSEQRDFWIIDQTFYSAHPQYSACNLFSKA